MERDRRVRLNPAMRELALNNLILSNLKAGRSGMARAWLNLALDEAASRQS